jgi:hypothetical protein
MSEDQTTPIRAAGGIVKGVGRNAGKIAVVFRNRYKDEAGHPEKGLPKGKPKAEDGGSELKNALREVREETGIIATTGKFIHRTEYKIGNDRKTVDYYLMEAPDDNETRPSDEEVAEIRWMTPSEAIVVLTHENDRELIQRLSGNVLREAGSIRRLLVCWRGSAPERARLDGAINDALIDLSLAGMPARASSWWQGADRHLAQAQRYLADRDLQQGWCSLASANRFMVLGETSPERLRSVATKLLKEASKLSDWRAAAVITLISRDEGKTLDNSVVNQPMRLVQALAIRDDQFETNYFKIALRRGHLIPLAWLLMGCIAATLMLSHYWVLPAPLNNFSLLVAVVLFGAMGASLSVARSLLKADVTARIPAQKLSAFVDWMRPVIGAAAALVACVLLKVTGFHIFNVNLDDPIVILAAATISGFSERFIVGAIEDIAKDKDGGGSKA